MIWSDGFTASYYITRVDPATWRDIGRMEITGGSVERNSDDLMQSADINMTERPASGETWVRIWLDAEQGSVEHVPLFTGLTSVPSRDIDGLRESFKVECYSVLKPADDILTEIGYYIPAEVQGPQAAARLLRVGPAPVTVAPAETYPRLTEAIVAEDKETYLTLARKVLDAIGWQMIIEGNGSILIREASDTPVQIFDANTNDCIETSITDEQDMYSCPNVFRAISDDLTAIARDDDPTSALSTVTRGREVWAQETSVTLGTNESLAAYAMRKLKELQDPARTVSYSRRFDDAVNVGDVIRINHPEVGIDGAFRVQSQTFELAHGCRITEEAVEI